MQQAVPLELDRHERDAGSVAGLQHLKDWLEDSRQGDAAARPPRPAWTRRRASCCSASRAAASRWWPRRSPARGGCRWSGSTRRALRPVRRRSPSSGCGRRCDQRRGDGAGGALDRRDREGLRLGRQPTATAACPPGCSARSCAGCRRTPRPVSSSSPPPTTSTRCRRSCCARAGSTRSSSSTSPRLRRATPIFAIPPGQAQAATRRRSTWRRWCRRPTGSPGPRSKPPIVSAMYRAFAAGKVLTTDSLLTENGATQPLSRTRSRGHHQAFASGPSESRVGLITPSIVPGAAGSGWGGL